MQLPLRLRDPHQQLLILNGDPAREHLHRVLEIAVHQYLPRAVDERCACRVQHVETAAKRAFFAGWEGEVRVAEQHEDVPDAELRGEGDGVVEEG